MVFDKSLRAIEAQIKAFVRARRGNVAMIFALSLIPIMVAAGAGVDLARALIVRARLAEALNSAGLAVGATNGLTTAQIQALAQNYFNANYTASSSYGTPAAVTINQGTDAITLSTSVAMPTTLMGVAGIKTVTVGYTSQVVWGQTKLWVSLVLDNTGSMTQADSTGTTKLAALKTATHQLLTTLQGAAATAGDVKVAIIPFSKDVNVGTTNVNAAWIDWTDWQSAPSNGTPSTSVGPGSSCPYSNNNNGYTCQSTPTNGSSSTSTVPSSGSYKGYICPGVDSGSKNSGRLGRYYNGCFNSVPTKTQTTTQSTPTTTTTGYSCTSNSNGNGVCTGSTTASNPTHSTGQTTTTTTTTDGYTGDSSSTSSSTGALNTGNPSTSCKTKSGKTTCTTTWNTTQTTTSTTITSVAAAPYNHTWIANATSTWGGCIMDRQQDYDIANTAPSSTATDFPAENAQSCVPTVMLGTMSYDWTALSGEVDSMTAGGSTNQPIGLAWGWQAQTNTAPLSSGTLPDNTSQYIILVSDGLNTQDRWNGDGSDQSTQVDARMSSLCTAAKSAGFVIYTIYVDLNGTQGNSTVLQHCATDSTKYFDLTTSGAIVTTLNTIAQQITQLRVAL